MSDGPTTVSLEADARREWAYRAGGQQAAFFDLDRTLISGSSAFTFAIAAWRKDMVPSGQFARDAVGAVAFKLRGDGGDHDSVAKVRERILRAVEGSRQQDMVALNETIIPKLLDKVRPEATKAARVPPPPRPRHLHRLRGAGGDRGAPGPGPRA